MAQACRSTGREGKGKRDVGACRKLGREKCAVFISGFRGQKGPELTLLPQGSCQEVDYSRIQPAFMQAVTRGVFHAKSRLVATAVQCEQIGLL